MTQLKRSLNILLEKEIMIKNLFVALFIFIGIVSCKKDDDTATSNLLTNKKFVFALASSQEECDYLWSFGVNCSQFINFDADTAMVLLTDILYSGTYTLSENTITVTFLDGDSENPMIFKANEGFTELTRISDGGYAIWKLQVPGVKPWDL